MREHRGAVDAKEGGAWGGDVPLPDGGKVWGRGCAPSP